MSHSTLCDRGWCDVRDLSQLYNSTLIRHRGCSIAANIVFYRGEAIGNTVECPVYGRECVMGARHVLLQQVDARRAVCPRPGSVLLRPYFLDVDQQIGQPALDGIKVG